MKRVVFAALGLLAIASCNKSELPEPRFKPATPEQLSEPITAITWPFEEFNNAISWNTTLGELQEMIPEQNNYFHYRVYTGHFDVEGIPNAYYYAVSDIDSEVAFYFYRNEPTEKPIAVLGTWFHTGFSLGNEAKIPIGETAHGATYRYVYNNTIGHDVPGYEMDENTTVPPYTAIYPRTQYWIDYFKLND